MVFSIRPAFSKHWAFRGCIVLSCLGIGSSYSIAVGENWFSASNPETLVNWSGTHKVQVGSVLYPESTEHVESIIEESVKEGINVRVCGSGLSPNGIGFADSNKVCMSMSQLDGIIGPVDKDKMQITVQAGIRVSDLVDELKPHGLTLQNFASIAEQQIGGFYQVGAHGTGAKIPPVDEQIVSMKIVTPAKGTLTVSRESNPEIFRLARVGLGALGVVTEVTIQCIPRHQLHEKTWIMTREEVSQRHSELLRSFQHLRYMWIPFCDTVIAVGSNPAKDPILNAQAVSSDSEATNALKDMLYSVLPEIALNGTESFATLRGMILSADPLSKTHIVKLNQAEADFWKRNEGERIGFSDQILGFDCGDQQWVSEVAFPVEGCNDIAFMQELLYLIENENEIPAPSPIEQRWTSGSTASMSPAHGDPSALFSWVGIIMYLPSSDDEMEREKIKSAFMEYRGLCKSKLWQKYNAIEHWAKFEKEETEICQKNLQERIRSRLDIDGFLKMKKELDPKGTLSNDLVESIFF